MSDLTPAARQRRMLAMLDEHGQITVRRAAHELGVSDDTVRRDLDALHASGLLVRTHGGAIRPDPGAGGVPLASRRITRREAKERIARAAVGLVPDGATLLMNGGSTVLAVAAALGGRRELIVITNNLLLPGRLPEGVAREVYLLGGMVRRDGEVTLGPVELPARPPIPLAADVAVLGVGGLSERGFSAVNLAEAEMVAEMTAVSARVVVVCDTSKFARDVLALGGTLDTVDLLVTDAAPSGALGRALRRAGVEVVVA
jgi:DeoR/GlpR family transcriptional regulator of sugar metabolism